VLGLCISGLLCVASKLKQLCNANRKPLRVPRQRDLWQSVIWEMGRRLAYPDRLVSLVFQEDSTGFVCAVKFCSLYVPGEIASRGP
jgi:hypothetical protein